MSLAEVIVIIIIIEVIIIEVIIIKLCTVAASDMIMHLVFIILNLTFIQGHIYLHYESMFDYFINKKTKGKKSAVSCTG